VDENKYTWIFLLAIFIVVGVRFVWYLAFMPRCRICKKRIWPTKDNELYDRIHASCYWKTDATRESGGGAKPPQPVERRNDTHIPD